MASTETNPIRILIVEDFHAETEIILRELKDAELHYDASKAHTEEEFRQLIMDFNPDVILAPYSLKNTNALKLLKIARINNIHAPFILLAFDLSEDIAIDLLSEGIEDYVTRSTLKRTSVAIRKALERYKTEMELRISESLYKEAQSIAKVGSWFMKPPSKELNWSEEMYAIHGMELGPVSIEKVRALTISEDHEVFDTSTERLLNGEDTPLVYRIRMKETDDIKYLLANGKVTKNAVGEIVSLSGTVQDISDRITAQLELERSKSLLVEAQKIAKVGSWEWVIGEDEVKWSEEMYRIYERSEPTVLLQDVRSYIHPDDKHRVNLVTDNDLTEAFIPVIEYRIKLPTGKIKHVISSARQIKNNDGMVTGLIGTLQDVTDHALINEKLQTLSLVASETINGVAIHDEQGKVVWINKGFTRITGYSIEDVEGKEPWSVVSSDNTNDTIVRMSNEKVLAGKPFSADNVLRKKDGDSVWVNVTYTPILDDDGKLTKIVSIGTDITKLKELEQLQKITLERFLRSKEQLAKRDSQDS